MSTFLIVRVYVHVFEFELLVLYNLYAFLRINVLAVGREC